MTEHERIIALEQALDDVITNLREDVSEGEWSKHLRYAVETASELLLPQE